MSHQAPISKEKDTLLQHTSLKVASGNGGESGTDRSEKAMDVNKTADSVLKERESRHAREPSDSELH